MLKRRKIKVLLSCILVMACLITAMPMNTQAATKKTVKSISVQKKSVSLYTGKTTTVKVTVNALKKVKASDLKVTVKSSNKKIALVKVKKSPGKSGKSGDSSIQITAKSKGTAKITVTTVNADKKGKKMSKTITVNVKKKSSPTESEDFKLRSDIAGTSDSIKFTKDIRSIKLSVYASSLPTRDTISKYVWYKDGKEITTKDLKYATSVNQSTFEAVETGKYKLKIITSHSTYNPNTLMNETTETVYTSNTISIGTEIEKPATDKVKWTTEVKTIEKQWAYKDESTGENFLFPIVLKRELVSFNPWPTTVEQVEYVIKNCDDPFVIGALYVVALDNYNYVEGQTNIEKRGITSMIMTNALATGGFINGLDVNTLGIQPSEKNTIQTMGYNGLGILASGAATTDKENGYVYQYAPRTYCEGATNENGYAPNGNAADINDKTKWKIVVDQYPYCFDQVVDETYVDVDPIVKREGTCTYTVTDKNGKREERTADWSSMPALHKDPKYITVCPEHFQLEKDTEDGPLIQNDSNQLIRTGLIWSSKSNRWVATDYATMNGFTHEKQGLPAHYNYQGQGLFSNAYVAPEALSDF